MRDELLNVEILDTLREVQVLVERWREHYSEKPSASPGCDRTVHLAIVPPPTAA